MRKTILAATLMALALPAGPALADPPHWAPAHGKRAKDARHYQDYDRARDYREQVYRQQAYRAQAYREQVMREQAYRQQLYRQQAYRQRASYGAPRYDRYGRYVTPQPLRYNDRVWEGSDGRYYCRRRNGTTGLIVGGAVGALLGRAIDGGRERTLGTILGAAGGALLGRSIDRGELRCR